MTKKSVLLQGTKPLQKHDERLESLLQTLPVGISILGKDRVPLYINTALKKILKLSTDELEKLQYRERKYFRPDGTEMPPSEFPSTRAFEEGRAIHDVEIGILTEDGEEIWTTVSAIPFNHGNWCVVVTTTDTTQQKEFEQALQKQTEALLERIKELNCLYGISDLVEQPNITLDKIFQGTVELIPPAWHYPEATSARIIYDGHEYRSKGFQASRWKQSYDIDVHGKKGGSIEVFCAVKMLDQGNSPCLDEEDNLLYAISERLGRITERFEAEERLIELATTDPLTGIYNRRHFFELVKAEIARAERYQYPLTCMMLDIDFFKALNDSHGHLFGDKVLQEMVKRCQENIRQIDIFARYGGDEFVILLPNSDAEHAQRVAKRLCNAFHEHSLPIDGKDVSLTLSLGIASISKSDELNLDTLLNRADQALYEAKKKGRNQVSFWGQTD